MSRINPIKLLLLNLAERVPPTVWMYKDRATAYTELKALTGQDFGDDLEAWFRWYNTARPEGRSRISMKLIR